MIGEALRQLALGLRARILRDVRTAVVARIEEYDPGSQTCRARPLVPEQTTEEGEVVTVEPQSLHGIPVLQWGSSRAGLTVGLEAGDPVVLLVRHRSHQEADGGAEPPITPQSSDRMSLAESVALGGYVRSSDGQPSGHYRADGQPVLWIGAGDALHIGAGTASIALARADHVQSQLDALKTWLDAHTHNYTDQPSGSVQPTTPPIASSPSPPDVASSRAKVDE